MGKKVIMRVENVRDVPVENHKSLPSKNKKGKKKKRFPITMIND